MQWGAVGLMNVCSKVFYKHVLTFSEGGRPDWSLHRYLSEFLSGNTFVDLFNAALIANVVTQITRKQFLLKYYKRTFDPTRFLAKLAVMRLSVDIGMAWASCSAPSLSVLAAPPAP